MALFYLSDIMRGFPLIQRLHEETKKQGFIPFDDAQWPESWKKVEFKEYPRMPFVELPPPQSLGSISFEETLKRRASRRSFDKTKSLTLQELSALLYWSAGLKKNDDTQFSNRFYPSGGARYPLEIYLSLRESNACAAGIYHYNVRRHVLEQIHTSEGDKEIRTLPNYPWAADASILLFVTAIFERSMRKYKERGYRFTQLEAGGLFQNFYLVSTVLGLPCTGVGVPIDDTVAEILDLSAEEQILVQLAIGK